MRGKQARMRVMSLRLFRRGGVVAGLAGAIAIAGTVVAAAAAASPAATLECDMPGYLLTTDSRLDKVAQAIDRERRLQVLVIGTLSSSLPGADEAAKAYPARFEAALQARLPGIAVHVAAEILPKTTAEEMVPLFAGLMAVRKPALIVWQTGTTDAIRAVDPDDFRAAADDGVAALAAAGADVVLINPQYSPRLETMISLTPYLDRLRLVAQQRDVPLFDRFAIMRHWNESGTFDLFGPVKGLDMARAVHDCLGRALATFVVDAARIDPAKRRAQP